MSHAGRSGRDELEIEALVTDRYLEWLLGGRPSLSTAEGDRPETPIRLASERLRSELPRFHPSFRFEERLAVRLAEAAAASRARIAAGAEGILIPMVRGLPGGEVATAADPLAAAAHPLAATAADPLAATAADPLATTTAADPADEPSAPPIVRRPLLVGGAVASAALSIAGAAWVAWRRSHAATPRAGRLAPSRGAD